MVWTKPPENWLLLNADGALDVASGIGGLISVIWNHLGEFVGAFYLRLTSPFSVEIWQQEEEFV